MLLVKDFFNTNCFIRVRITKTVGNFVGLKLKFFFQLIQQSNEL